MSKEHLVKVLASRVKSGDILGLGSGSTAELAVIEIGKRIKSEKLVVSGVPTSLQIARCAHEAGINVLSPIPDVELTWAFDGADEIDPSLALIKGRGAAMLMEKIVAKRAKGRLVILASEDKFVSALGTKFPVPIEVIPSALSLVLEELALFDEFSSVVVRESSAKYGPTITESGNLILDVSFRNITPELESKIKNITGVVESGLFFNLTKEILLAAKDGIWSAKLSGASLVREQLLKF